MTELELGDVHTLRQRYLECRVLGHAWRIVYVGQLAGAPDDDIRVRARRVGGDAVRLIACTRCRTERVDICQVGYGRTAYHYLLLARSYRYPDAYHVAGMGRSRDLLQTEMFARTEGDHAT